MRILINKRSDFTNNATMGEVYNNKEGNDGAAGEEETFDKTVSCMPTGLLGVSGRGNSSQSNSSRSGRNKKFDKSKFPEGHPNSNNPSVTAAADTEEATAATTDKKKKGLLSFLSSRKSNKDVDLNMTGDDDESVELPLEENKYNVNALNVPVLDDDQDGPGVDKDVDQLLDDPYAELEGRQYPSNSTSKEALMNDPEYDEEEDSKKRFLMGLVSKSFFLLGAILFLVLAVHDLKRVKNAGPPSEADLAAAANTQDNMGIAFVNASVSTTTSQDRSGVGLNNEATVENTWGVQRKSHNHHNTNSRHLQSSQNWYTEYWANLPGTIKEAAVLLGYDSQTWDAGDSVYTDRLYWHQLTSAQQEAAALVFNYNESSWNDFVDRFWENMANTPAPSFGSGTEAPTFAPDPKDTFYKNIWWDNLPTNVQDAAATLAYTKDSWDNDEWVLTKSLFWSQLTEEERNAADTMGYNEETWNEQNGGQTPPPIPASDESEENEDAGNANNGSDGDIVDDQDGSDNQGGDDTGSDDTTGVDGDGEGENGEGKDATKKNEVSSLVVNIIGEYPPESRGAKYRALYICAAICMMLVGILDGLQQKLAFHAVMILAGITGIMAGSFTMFKDENALNVCHSLSTHFFLLQAVLLIYSRLLLTYDNVVRKTLAVGDGLFAIGALMNVVVSYLRYDDTTESMGRAAVAAAVFWCIAALIYVGVTIVFWTRKTKSWKNNSEVQEDEVSIAESCNVVPSGDGGGECEIAYHEPTAEARKDALLQSSTDGNNENRKEEC